MEIVINDGNIGSILASSKPVIIDFWATWCGPCRALSPIIDELATEFSDRVTVAKCNVDDCPDISEKYGIRNIPTLLFFNNGEIVNRSVGVLTKKELIEKTNNLL